MKLNIFSPRQSTVVICLMMVVLTVNIFASAKALLVLLTLLVIRGRGAIQSIDSVFGLLLVALAIYFLNANLTGYSEVPFYIIYLPSLLYLVGKWYGKLCRSEGEFLVFQVVVGCSLSLLYVISVVLNIYDHGFIGLSRSIDVIGAVDSELSATVIAGNLIFLTSIGGVLCVSSPVVSLRFRFLIIALILIDLLVIVRVGSRTHLILLPISFIIGYLVNRRHLSRKTKFIFYFSMISVSLLLINFVDESSLVSTYFADRLNDDSASALTAGGRMERWAGSLEMLAQNPFGWNSDSTGYSHNLWLDAGRVGGWAAFLGFLLFSIISTVSILRSLKRNRGDLVFVTTALCLTVGFNLLFFVEPILDGFVYPFSAYCIFLGSVVSFRGKQILRYTRWTH